MIMFSPIKVHSANVQQYHSWIRGHHHSFPITMDNSRITRKQWQETPAKYSRYEAKIYTIPPRPECYYCKKKGYVMADCWHLKNTNRGATRLAMMTVRAWSSLRFQVILQSWLDLLMSTHLSFPKELYRLWAQVSWFQSPFCVTLEQISPYC